MPLTPNEWTALRTIAAYLAILVSCVLTIPALIISVVTLYVAHLRGPKIKLAKAERPHKCSGVVHAPNPQEYDPDRLQDVYGDPIQDPEAARLDTNIIVANQGNRSGILFDFIVHPGNETARDVIRYIKLTPAPDEELPISLRPGEGWKTTLSMYVKSKSTTLEDFVGEKQILLVQAEYWASSGLFGRQHKQEDFRVELESLRQALIQND